MAERIVIASDALTAEISPFGAELQYLYGRDRRNLMSDGDPQFWTGRAPLLFPIVGRLNGDTALIDGRRYALPKHGFARRSEFALVEHDAARALFRLTDSEATRAVYPFAFELDAAYRIAGTTLSMTVTVRNTGDVPLPASFGFHPAFAWPLPGAARAQHRIVFEHDEPATLRAITPQGLIAPERRPTPVVQGELPLTDALFTDDALVWTELSSRRLSYGATDGLQLRIDFPDTDWLGIWSKPGANFVCIEPWAGIADAEGYTGEFRDKPGVFELAPHHARAFAMRVTPSW